MTVSLSPRLLKLAHHRFQISSTQSPYTSSVARLHIPSTSPILAIGLHIESFAVHHSLYKPPSQNQSPPNILASAGMTSIFNDFSLRPFRTFRRGYVAHLHFLVTGLILASTSLPQYSTIIVLYHFSTPALQQFTTSLLHYSSPSIVRYYMSKCQACHNSQTVNYKSWRKSSPSSSFF